MSEGDSDARGLVVEEPGCCIPVRDGRRVKEAPSGRGDEGGVRRLGQESQDGGPGGWKVR
jgi:hypothetical protein